MSTPPRISTRRLRQLRAQADKLVDARERAEEDILVFIHETTAEGASNAAVAGLFPRTSASGIPAKAAKGALLAERRSRRKAAGG